MAPGLVDAVIVSAITSTPASSVSKSFGREERIGAEERSNRLRRLQQTRVLVLEPELQPSDQTRAGSVRNAVTRIDEASRANGDILDLIRKVWRV